MRWPMFVVTVIVLIGMVGCGGGGGFDPTPGWPNGRIVSNIPLPHNTTDYAQIGTTHFVVKDYKLFRSKNEGGNWEEIPLYNGAIAIAADGGKLYCANSNGIVASEDMGDSFVGEYGNLYDDTMDVDVNEGYGWMVVENWGTDSGPHRKTPADPVWRLCRGDLPWSAMSLYNVKVDTTDPANRAYVFGIKGRFMTTDGGQHWTPY